MLRGWGGGTWLSVCLVVFCWLFARFSKRRTTASCPARSVCGGGGGGVGVGGVSVCVGGRDLVVCVSDCVLLVAWLVA